MRGLWVLAGLALGGCAADVVLKPAVVRFQGDSAVAAAAVNQGYDALVVDANRNTAMLLAANPECGMNTRVLARAANPELAAVLARPGAQAAADALAAAERVPRRRVPGESFCVAPFETRVAERVLGAGYADLPVRTVPLLLLDGGEFEAQRAAVAAVTE